MQSWWDSSNVWKHFSTVDGLPSNRIIGIEKHNENLLIATDFGLSILENEKSAWPDSSNVRFLGYKIDTQGFPGFRYSIGSAVVTDQLTADNGGITRRFLVDNPVAGNLFSVMATGKHVRKIEDGLYQVDDRYYVRVDKKAKVVLRQMGDMAELLLPIGGPTSYNMFW